MLRYILVTWTYSSDLCYIPVIPATENLLHEIPPVYFPIFLVSVLPALADDIHQVT